MNTLVYHGDPQYDACRFQTMNYLINIEKITIFINNKCLSCQTGSGAFYVSIISRKNWLSSKRKDRCVTQTATGANQNTSTTHTVWLTGDLIIETRQQRVLSNKDEDGDWIPKCGFDRFPLQPTVKPFQLCNVENGHESELLWSFRGNSSAL